MTFAERLRRCSHEVHAVQLRGHDRPAGRIWHRVHHYVEDVGVAAARFAEPPVLVGHSLGTLVVQRYVENAPALGVALLAPLPRRGTLLPVVRLAARHPAALARATLALRLLAGDRCWQAFLCRFDLEHTFRLFEQTLGWTARRLEQMKRRHDPR